MKRLTKLQWFLSAVAAVSVWVWVFTGWRPLIVATVWSLLRIMDTIREEFAA